MRMLLLVAVLFGLVIPAGAGATYPYPVTVTVTGPGAVTDATGAINCPGNCSSAYPSGQSVTFTETPQSGQQFGGWSTAAPVLSGCTTTSATCQVKIDCDACGSSVSVAATFDPVLNVAVTGSGTVTGTGGVNCPSGLCSFMAAPGQQIQLTAIPTSGYEFSSWSGGQCAAQGSPCTFTINSGQTVTASFTKLPSAPGGSPSTPPTPAQPPTPPAEPQAVVSLGSLIAGVNKHLARFEIDCRKSQVTCSGKLTLTVQVAKTRRRKAHTLTLGSAGFSVTAGKRAALDVHLSTTAGALLNADHGRLHAAATLALTGLKPGTPTAISLHRHT
jgi:Divergent InlB B-repeat domain